MLVAVIGLGTFGARTAARLYEQKADVVAIDKDFDLVEKIKNKVTRSVCLDVTDEKALRAEEISDVDTAIVAIGDNVEMSILAVATLRKLGVGRVIARAKNNLHEHVLREVGASEIVRIEEEMGDLVASKIISPHIMQRYSFDAGYSLVEMKVVKEWAGKTLVETKLRQNYQVHIVAIQKKIPIITDEGRSDIKKEVNYNPLPMDTLEEDDVLVLVGNDEKLNKLFSDEAEG